MATRIRLGELLVRAGVIDELKLRAALSEQQKWGGRLGKILVDMNYVSEDLLVKALSKQLGVSRATFSAQSIPPEVVEKVDIAFAQGNELCPEAFDKSRRVLTVATADPTNVAALDELRFRTGYKIETTIAGHQEIERAIQKYLRPVPAFGIEVPDAIELTRGESGFRPSSAYEAAMAASGLTSDDDATIPAESSDSWSPAPRTVQASESYPDQPRNGSASPAAAPPAMSAHLPSGPPRPASEPGQGAMELAGRLDGAQKQQAKALRVMLELLIEKGVFSRDEYIAFVNRR